MKDIRLNDTEQLYRISVLRQEMREVAAQVVEYRFCVSRFVIPVYYVEILRDGERAAAEIGNDYAEAQILFDSIVRGTVTPCTLEDIARDAKNSRLYSLQNAKNML